MAQKTVAISITSNRAKVESEVTQAINRALEICGGKAETYAKKLCPVDTGYLRNSIAHGRTGGKMSVDTYRSDNGGKQNKPIRSGKYDKLIPESDKPTMIIGTNVEYAPYQEIGYHKGNKLIGGKKFMSKALSDHINEYKEVFQGELNKI